MRWLIATLVLAASIATAEAQPAAQPSPQPAAQPLNAEAARSFNDFQNFAPHRAFVVGADGKANWQAGVTGLVIGDPEGFKGHGAGAESSFARKFGPCIVAFVETRKRQAPCGD